jgi:hypothetical protein
MGVQMKLSALLQVLHGSRFGTAQNRKNTAPRANKLFLDVLKIDIREGQRS